LNIQISLFFRALPTGRLNGQNDQLIFFAIPKGCFRQSDIEGGNGDSLATLTKIACLEHRFLDGKTSVAT
jgi:hypothetical protein